MANEESTIQPHQETIIGTGTSIAAPEGTYARIAPRSGLAAKHSIDIGAGVVDQDYRGELKVLVINYSDYAYQIRPGDRIAQLILERILLANPIETDSIDNTSRGDRGFGSTGYQRDLTKKLCSLKAVNFEKEFLNRVREAANKDKQYRDEQTKNPGDHEDLLFFNNRLRIPDDEALKIEYTTPSMTTQWQDISAKEKPSK